MEEEHIFIIGSKGIPAKYGGFETFVENLTRRKIKKNIKYYVSCIAKENGVFEYNNAKCFKIKVPNIGSSKAVYYDIKALKKAIKYIKLNSIDNAIIYILACRIGPFIKHYKATLKKLNCKLYINPDGHEWQRSKWNSLIKKYWKMSERLMVKQADLLICDSKNIENYIQEKYNKYTPKTEFIAYGADILKNQTKVSNEEFIKWYKEKNINPYEYYLIVGRFVPENNYEIMITEFMKTNTKKNLVIITNTEESKFYEKLKRRTNFDKDTRIKFVGTVYNQELLSMIRKHAYAYIHGHEVGGTNPSLLEALGTTDLNLLLDVGFNKEVGQDSAIYWNKEEGNLSEIINYTEKISIEERNIYSTKAKKIINEEYNWKKIIDKYEYIFTNTNK